MSLYQWRIRRSAVQELLAGVGIAVGVALVFGVLVANTTLTAPAKEFFRALAGTARLQLVARSDAGFATPLVRAAAKLAGVIDVASILRANIAVAGLRGQRSAELIGLTPGLIRVSSVAARDAQAGQLLLTNKIGLPSTMANEIGVRAGGSVKVLANGHAFRGPSFPLVGVSVLDHSDVVVGSLSLVQALTKMPRRVTQLLVKPRPGADRQVTRELQRMVGGRLDVEPADSELLRLDATTKPSNESTILFAAVGATIGFLLTLSAMLLTVPEHRRTIADLRIQGFEKRQIVMIIGSQALALGVAASLLGIALGDFLSHTLFRQSPTYLAFAFPVGAREVVHLKVVLLALACGLLATLIASLPAILDLRPARRVDAALSETTTWAGLSRRATLWLTTAGVILILITTAFILLEPSLTIIGAVTLTIATLCLIPAVFAIAMHALEHVGERRHGSMLAVAAAELRATPLHSIGLAGIAALAVYGSVAIRGAQHDLIAGLDNATAEFFRTADVWVTTGANEFITTSFQAKGDQRALTRVPGIAGVRVYQGGLLNVGVRRMWIRARPRGDRSMVEAGQILKGSATRADGLIRRGGWAAISGGLASERHLGVGDRLTLPTPSGLVRFGVAAITTNVGWSPGAITINAADYRRYWKTLDPTALEVDLKPGVTPAEGQSEVRHALGTARGLQVQTAQQLDSRFDANASQGLRSLGEISTLLLLAAALAVATALSATIWQRRSRLASLKVQGFDRMSLWRALLLESSVVLGVGCALGAIVGIYGHSLADRWLERATSFPTPYALGLDQVLLALTLVAIIALIVVALLGSAVAQVRSSVSFQE